jgi:hypothetical protein
MQTPTIAPADVGIHDWNQSTGASKRADQGGNNLALQPFGTQGDVEESRCDQRKSRHALLPTHCHRRWCRGGTSCPWSYWSWWMTLGRQDVKADGIEDGDARLMGRKWNENSLSSIPSMLLTNASVSGV